MLYVCCAVIWPVPQSSTLTEFKCLMKELVQLEPIKSDSEHNAVLNAALFSIAHLNYTGLKDQNAI